MPTELTRATARSITPISSARNGNIVVIALAAALVTLQLAGLAVLERSHAQPVPAASVTSSDSICAMSTGGPATHSSYD
jgi:hypothetical protein